MSKVIVYVNGGNVQGVISDTDDVEIMIVDYDNEVESSKDRDFESVPCDPQYFLATLKGKEY